MKNKEVIPFFILPVVCLCSSFSHLVHLDPSKNFWTKETYDLKGPVAAVKIYSISDHADSILTDVFRYNREGQLTYKRKFSHLLEETEPDIVFEDSLSYNDKNLLITYRGFLTQGGYIQYEYNPELTKETGYRKDGSLWYANTCTYLGDSVIATQIDVKGSHTIRIYNKDRALIREIFYSDDSSRYSEQTCTFDAHKHLLVEFAFTENTGNTYRKTTYKYDKKGNNTEEIEFSEDNKIITKSLKTYDDHNELTSATDYDSLGKLNRKETWAYKYSKSLMTWESCKSIRYFDSSDFTIQTIESHKNFDAYGNYLTKITTSIDHTQKQTHITLRKIEYYK